MFRNNDISDGGRPVLIEAPNKEAATLSFRMAPDHSGANNRPTSAADVVLVTGSGLQ